MISVIGWILWVLVGLNAIYFLATSILLVHADPGGRRLFRQQAFIWCIGLLLTAVLPISKLHLLWIWPFGLMAPWAIINLRLRRTSMGIQAEAVKRHLEEESGREVWSYSEMRRLFRIRKIISPREQTEIWKYPEFEGWWLTKESGIGMIEVIRRADSVKGSLYFKDYPRFCFMWSPDDAEKAIEEFEE